MKIRLILFLKCILLIGLTSCSTTLEKETKKIEIDSNDKTILPDKIRIDSVQSNQTLLSTLYAKAIEDYIAAVSEKDHIKFDTLFFIQRNNGLPDDFPIIQLPSSIRQVKVNVLSQEEADLHKLHYSKTSPCINLIGNVEKSKSEFVFITFYPEFKHQYDCYINYNYNSTKNNYELESVSIEVLIDDKNGKPDHFEIYKGGKHIGDKSVK